MAFPESATTFLEKHKQSLRSQPRRKRIVFPEGGDPRVIAAATRLASEGLLHPVLLGGPKLEGCASIDPATCPDAKQYAGLYYERRRAKGVTEVEAAAVARKPLYFGTLEYLEYPTLMISPS